MLNVKPRCWSCRIRKYPNASNTNDWNLSQYQTQHSRNPQQALLRPPVYHQNDLRTTRTILRRPTTAMTRETFADCSEHHRPPLSKDRICREVLRSKQHLARLVLGLETSVSGNAMFGRHTQTSSSHSSCVKYLPVIDEFAVFRGDYRNVMIPYHKVSGTQNARVVSLSELSCIWTCIVFPMISDKNKSWYWIQLFVFLQSFHTGAKHNRRQVGMELWKCTARAKYDFYEQMLLKGSTQRTACINSDRLQDEKSVSQRKWANACMHTSSSVCDSRLK